MIFIWIQFAICVVLIAISGSKLSGYGNVIAEKTGISGTFVGLVLLAVVTSLPELISSISAVTLANAPDIAIGAILGSCVFNLLILVVLDFLYREQSVYSKAHQGHVLSAAFCIVLIGFTGFSVLESSAGILPSLAHVGLYTPVIVAAYLLAMRTVFQYERDNRAEYVSAVTEPITDLTLRQATIRYGAAALVVIAVGTWLPIVGNQIADAMGWKHSFVGTLLIAFATSVPEIVVTLAALRLGALNMAIGNLLGSNLFNILIVPIVDVIYIKGPILSHVSAVNAVSALSAMIMTGVFIIGLFNRSTKRLYRTVGWVSLSLFCLYLLNSYVLYINNG
jgi:cation:H+ antiporter